MLRISSRCSLDRCASASWDAAVFSSVSSTVADPAVRLRVPTRNEDASSGHDRPPERPEAPGSP